MKRFLWLVPLAAMIAVGCGGGSSSMPWEDELGGGEEQKPDPTPDGTLVEVGKTLPAWKKGELDIHFINTGRGECAFYILPDGTTLLVDAGEVKASHDATDTSADAAVPQKPNADVRPYIAHARYIKHFAPNGRVFIDYCAPSHFHIDHIGSTGMATETAAAGYKKSGLTALFDEVPYGKVIDRAYPDYPTDDSHATIPAMDGQLRNDWAKFVKWGVAEGKFKAERFEVGKEQITLLNDPKAYAGFKILNICANGFVWSKNGISGSKSGVGNPASCGFHLSYGLFDYIACGDLTSAPQNLVAYYFRDFIGEGHLDAFKCHHHLSANAWGSQMQAQKFNPRVIVNQNFYTKQPDAGHVNDLMDNKYSFWVKDFFTTNLHPYYHQSNKDAVSKMTGYDGHIVIRVANGGGEFYVYMLDDTNFEYKVKSIHGPYTSK
ncbi:MAG: hypothetical protein J6K33_01570 [Alistipes sp.]|nr:hypothetical protein [Alistipes sp.]